MRILYINRVEWLEVLMSELLKFGHERVTEKPDVILGMTNSLIDKILDTYVQYPQAKKVMYNWDTYGWFFTKPRENDYDWNKYGDLLKRSDLVLCPSECTITRMKEFYKIDGKVVKTFIPIDHFQNIEVKDDRFVLQSLRDLPDDNVDWFEKACNELKIPYITSRYGHKPFEEYKKLLASCSFTVSSYAEASTGGLHLIEGYSLGKPCLIIKTPYHGAIDYFGFGQVPGIVYFENDFDNFKKKLWHIWNNTPQLNRSKCYDWVVENYSVARMAKEVSDELRRV